MGVCICGFCNVWVCVGVGFVVCGCVALYCVGVCMCGFVTCGCVYVRVFWQYVYLCLLCFVLFLLCFLHCFVLFYLSLCFALYQFKDYCHRVTIELQ